MKKLNKKIPKSHLPKFEGGGLGMVGKDIKNTGLFLADTALSEWAPNVITQDQYSDTKYGANLGKVASVHESFDSQSPIRKNVSKMWTDDRSSGMNEEQQKAFNQVQPIAKLGSSIGEMWTTKGLGSIGQGSTNAAGEFQPSKANGFAKSLGDLSQAGTKNYTPNMYDNNAQTTVGDLNNSRRASMYPNGGMNMQPNAEIESEENVVAPNGGFLQANGPSHEQGGVPVALPGNSMIFSDRLKLGKKTFAELNKVNNTSKEDKILESNKYGNTSKRTAELMKFVKNKNSKELFGAQEALKQAKVQAYAKKMGITLPQESPEQGMQFPNGGTLPMYNIDPNPQYNINPNFNQLPKDTTYQGFNTNYNLAPQITPMPATNDSTVVKNRRIEYANGGMLPKYAWGDLTPEQQFLKTKFMGAEQNQHNLAFNQMTGNTNSGYNLSQGSAFLQNSYAPGVLGMNDSMNSPSNPSNHNAQSSYNPNTLPWNRTNDSNQGPNGVAEKSNFTPQQQQFQEHTISTGNKGVNTPPGAKPNWMGIAEKGLNFAAQNAGNLYNLSRYNKPEIERYERAKANYLDPTAAIRDANEQTRRAEYNVRGASGGNAGTYLSNRVGLNAQNIENKDRIRQQYANSNAQIGNQVNQFNTEIAMREVIANAQNRARNRSGKGEAIGSMGYNTANQIMDNKKGNMDQETLQLMMKYYNTPEFQKYMKEYKGK